MTDTVAVQRTINTILLRHITRNPSTIQCELGHWTVCSHMRKGGGMIHNWFSHPLVNMGDNLFSHIWIIGMFCCFVSAQALYMLIILKVYQSACLCTSLYFGNISNHLCVATYIHATHFCLCLLSPSVQEDVEQGAVPFVRDESLREPSVRIHLHYLSR